MFRFLKKIRCFLLIKIKWRKYSFGKNPYIGRCVYLWAKTQMKIGNNFYIGKFSQIECDAIIGDNVIIANHVGLIGRYDHHFQQIGIPIRLSSQIRDKDYNWKGLDEKIIIEDDVWIGYGSIILTGVIIGTGSIIAAGSVVTSNIPPYSICGGVPAKKLRDRFENENDLKKHLSLIS